MNAKEGQLQVMMQQCVALSGVGRRRARAGVGTGERVRGVPSFQTVRPFEGSRDPSEDAATRIIKTNPRDLT